MTHLVTIEEPEVYTMESGITWGEFYLAMAELVSKKSKDPSTQVGAVIVRPDNTLCSIGYNGFPRAMPDRVDWLETREEKYSRIIHGEVNAYLNAHGEHIHGYTLYTFPFMPCDRCFVQMAQAGITTFIAPKLTDPALMDRWEASFTKTRKYAKEMNLKLEEIDLSYVNYTLHSIACKEHE